MLLPILALAAALAQAPAPLVLKAARLWDGKADRAVSPGVLVIRGARIEAVGAGASLPEGARVIDLGDATLMPGLIDAHVHLDGERSDDFRKDELDRLRKTIPELSLEAEERARRTLLAGFTTLRSLGSGNLIDVGLRNAFRAGVAIGPRIVASTEAIGATGGHCDPSSSYREGVLAEGRGPGVADSPDAIRARVRRAVRNGADVIKLCATGGVLSENDDVDVSQLTQAELDAAVDEAHQLRRKVAVHAHGSTGARRALLAGADSIEHGTFLDDETLRLLKQKGAVLVPTPLNGRYYDEQIARGARVAPKVLEKMRLARESRRRSVQRALELKVRIAFGTDAGVYPHGRNAEQLGILVEHGMRPVDALRSATSVDAEVLGLAAEIGSLEVGKLADVIAVPGDVLADVRATEHVLLVVKDGVVVRER